MTTSVHLTRRTAALLLIASLAACGGGGGSGEGGNSGGGEPGGGDGGGSGGGDGGGGGSNPGTSTVTGTYSLKSGAGNHAQMLADANSMGQQGFVLLSALTANITATSVDIGDFYVSDTAHTGHKFSYVQQTDVATMAEFVAQLNQQGANGYVFKSGAVFDDVSDIRNVFVKDENRSDTFSYEVSSEATTGAAFSEELNKQGARGYRYLGPQIVSGTLFGLYVKRNDSVTYQYQLDTLSGSSLASDAAALQKLLTDKGTQGWFMRGAEGLGDPLSMSFVAIYEKSSAQTVGLEYLVEPMSGSPSLEDMKNRMNTNAGNGFFFLSEIATADNKFSTISVKNSIWMTHPLAGVSFP